MSKLPEQGPEQPAANLVYGFWIYWVSIFASFVCTVGPFVSIINVNNNYINPHYLFSAIWEGKTPQQIWAMGGGFPGAHFWLNNLGKGDALIHFGVVLGCSSAVIALLAAGLTYLREKPRRLFWAVLCFVNMVLIICAVSGVVN
ncbi:MAG: hypothetical protein PVG90_09415 [Bacillota bacterium]|jgi:hypothetical protein